MIVAALMATVALAASGQPAHPQRVAEALAPAVENMQQKVGLPERVAGVYCTANVINGQQSRTIRCTLTMREANPPSIAILGTLAAGRCLRPVVFEDYSGRVTVTTKARGTWCYRFHEFAREVPS